MNSSDDESMFHSCDPEEYKGSFEDAMFQDACYNFQATPSPTLNADQVELLRRRDQIIELARNFKTIERIDDWRQPDVAKDGGFPLNDPVVLNRYRTAFKDVVKQIGRTIFSGKFNLAGVSFPIFCMSPESILFMIATMSIHSPLYMNAAALTTDPVQRMKLVMTTSLSFLYSCHRFDKPLNPVLGETYQGYHDDGTEVCME